MKIQSLSIVVPTKNKCVNACKFCVSRTHTNPYCDKISHAEESIEFKDYYNRLQFARDNGCNVVVLTGTGEPIQNPKFLEFFSEINSTLNTPFKSIEIQTTGVLLDEETIAHLRAIGVTTISFSISNIFDNKKNLELIECHEKLKFDVFEIIKLVKKYDFNLRLSLNLVNDYDKYSVKDVIDRCSELGADQVTFRKLYKSELNNEIDKWIEENASKKFYNKLIDYVKNNGKLLGVLPFGPSIYDIKEMSVVIDDDCMSEDVNKDTYKYLILRENAKLYSKWETKASLVF
jgi:MoaA/NifB/PqqE/SkfB family radical SAM enzyme